MKLFSIRVESHSLLFSVKHVYLEEICVHLQNDDELLRRYMPMRKCRLNKKTYTRKIMPGTCKISESCI
jgi:hypothetical protein